MRIGYNIIIKEMNRKKECKNEKNKKIVRTRNERKKLFD